MTTINLHQSQQNIEDDKKKISSGIANGGFIFSIGILVATLLALGGIKIYISTVQKQNLVLAESIKQEGDGLTGFGNLEQIIDMQTRLAQIKNNLGMKNGEVSRTVMTTVLDQLGGTLNTGIVVSKYNLANKSLAITFEANNFNEASRQILNFKKSDYFVNVNLKNIARGEKGVSVDMEMNIK